MTVQERKSLEEERQALAVKFSEATAEYALGEKATREARLVQENLRIKVDDLADRFASHVDSDIPEVFYKTGHSELVVVRMNYPRPPAGRAYEVKVVTIEAKE